MRGAPDAADATVRMLRRALSGNLRARGYKYEAELGIMTISLRPFFWLGQSGYCHCALEDSYPHRAAMSVLTISA